MTHTPTAITVERVRNYVEVVVGDTKVRLTLIEAEALVAAVERAIDFHVRDKNDTVH